MVLFQSLLGNFKVSMPSSGSVWGAVLIGTIVLAFLLVLGLMIFLIIRKNRERQYTKLCIIVEPVQGGVALRNIDWGGVFKTEGGDVWEFWKEKPDVQPLPPKEDEVIGHHHNSGLKTHSGYRFPWSKSDAEKVLAKPNMSGLVVFMYTNNQYIPYQWDNAPQNPALRILRLPDIKFFLDEQSKLLKRHIIRSEKWKEMLPLLTALGVGVVFLVGLGIFAWIVHRSDLTTNHALAVASESLQTAQRMGTTYYNVSSSGVA